MQQQNECMKFQPGSLLIAYKLSCMQLTENYGQKYAFEAIDLWMTLSHKYKSSRSVCPHCKDNVAMVVPDMYYVIDLLEWGICTGSHDYYTEVLKVKSRPCICVTL